MEFLIEMNKMKSGVKLKSVNADDLYDAVTKIATLLAGFCAENPFAYRVKPIVTNPGMLEFYFFLINAGDEYLYMIQKYMPMRQRAEEWI